MPAETQSIHINACPTHVFQLLCNPATLPVWTNGFVMSVHARGNVWTLQTKRGEQHWRVASNTQARTIDFYTEPQHPERCTRARIRARASSSTLTFTMIQWPDINAVRFAQMKVALAAELHTLKALAEGRTPCG